MGMHPVRLCIYEGCAAPYRHDPDLSALMGHLCILHREVMRLEQFARSMLREKKVPPPPYGTWA